MEQENKENKKVIICKDRKNEEFEITFNTECFGKRKIEDFRSKEEKRFNLKVKDSDIRLLDIASEELGISRNALINILLDIVLWKWLDEVEDFDTKVLIAASADLLIATSAADLENPFSGFDVWLHKVFDELVTTATLNSLRYGSDELPNYAGQLEVSGVLEEPKENLIQALIKKDRSEINKWKSCIKNLYKRSDSFEAVRKLIEKDQKQTLIEEILRSDSFEAECKFIEDAVKDALSRHEKND